jgi:carboxypeptidase Q
MNRGHFLMKLMLRSPLLSALAFLGLTAAVVAQDAAPTRTDEAKKAYKTAMEEADQKIAAEVKSRSELMKNLEYLTTQIGARLTGSKQMQQASEWTLKRFRDYGLDAHLETTEVPHAYYRGVDTAEIVSPISRRVDIHAMGWSKATPGEVSGAVGWSRWNLWMIWLNPRAS